MRETRSTDISKWSGLASMSKLGGLEIALESGNLISVPSCATELPPNCTTHFSSGAPSALPQEFSLAYLELACSSGLWQCTVVLTQWYLHFTEATGKKPHKVALDISNKRNRIFSKDIARCAKHKWPEHGGARTALHIAPFQICLNQSLFLHRQIAFHAITDFQFSLWSRQKIQGWN